MNPPSVTKSASLWFGKGASQNPAKVVAADAIALAMVVSGGAAEVLFFRTWATDGRLGDVKALFDYVIPTFAISALLVACVIFARIVANTALLSSSAVKFGRKGNLLCASSLLFIFSCCYRALNVADEGASMCRGRSTPFNAPVAGRAVATVGEIALVVQIATFLEDTSRRLGIGGASPLRFSSRKRFTIVPVCCAECFSWLGVLTGHSRFYCCEYVVWMLISLSWAWDAAECLHKSVRWSDLLTHAALLMGGLGLFFFNAVLEIPHFFRYHPSDTLDGSTVEVLSIFECYQDRDSPLWLKRLPFFFCYFLGCSWGSCALCYRYLRRGLHSKQSKDME